MILELVMTLLFGGLAILWGMRWGRLWVRKGATANNLFTGKDWQAVLFLGGYVGLLWLALTLPQWQILPLDWRVYGMRTTWTMMRVLLLGFCGLAFIVSWKTARLQVVAVLLLGLLGIGGFTATEAYFLSPIYASLNDRLLPNGLFQQTSNSSCAPTALANVLRLWNIDATESSVAKLAGTSRLGTSMPQLIAAAQGFGMDGMELSPSWEQMQRINRPGVLAVWLFSKTGREAHAVSLMAMTSETVTIADPDRGKRYQLTQPQFNRIWRRQYVPIFRSTETTLAPDQAIDYLQQLGYLAPELAPELAPGLAPGTIGQQPISPIQLESAIKAFQRAVGVRATGKLEPETVLLLTGSFLKDVPQLDQSTS